MLYSIVYMFSLFIQNISPFLIGSNLPGNSSKQALVDQIWKMGPVTIDSAVYSSGYEAAWAIVIFFKNGVYGYPTTDVNHRWHSPQTAKFFTSYSGSFNNCWISITLSALFLTNALPLHSKKQQIVLISTFLTKIPSEEVKFFLSVYSSYNNDMSINLW